MLTLSYRVEIKPKAIKQLEKLPKELTERILRKIVFMSDTPQSFMKKLESQNIWSLRIGDYRVLIDLYEKERKLDVIQVAHRKNVYKNIN